MHSLLHDIPRFFILFLEELFLIFNQMFSIRAFGLHVLAKLQVLGQITTPQSTVLTFSWMN